MHDALGVLLLHWKAALKVSPGGSGPLCRRLCEGGRLLLEWKGLLGPWGESNTLPMSVELEVAEAGGGVKGVRGELGAETVAPSTSLSGTRL